MSYKNTYCQNTEDNIERYNKAGWHHIDKLDKGTMYVKACMVLGREVCFLTDDPIDATKIDDVDPVNNERVTTHIDNSSYLEVETNYYSERGKQLIYIGSPADKPIITIENYTKWYNLYKVDTDGTVTKITDDIPDWLDHCPIPNSVLTYAKEKNWYIDEQSMEIIIGRLIKEKPETLELKDMFDIANYGYIYKK